MISKIAINNTNSPAEVLLIGQNKNVGGDEQVKIHNSPNVADGISAARDGHFDAIAVTTQIVDKALSDSLRQLRFVQPNSKILLLTQTLQEPNVIELMDSQLKGFKLIDDYYILPVSFEQTNATPKTKTSTIEPVADEQKKRIEILEKLVMQDELTGVKNRRFVREFLRQIIERAGKESLQVTLLTFDIDNFKKYNDLYGHAVGDNILRQATVLMQKCCRKQDIVGRIGGDEFAVIFWNLPANRAIGFEDKERRNTESQHPTEVINICERFRNELNNTNLPALGADGKGILAISGGIATFPSDGATVQELFERADKALLEAKRNGKNRVYLTGENKTS